VSLAAGGEKRADLANSGTERFADDLLGPEHDSEQASGACVTRSYVICSTPRSGSGLLFRALAQTGVFGIPLEYLNPLTRVPLAERWGCGPGLESYLDALHARRSTPDGLFAAKVHWDQIPRLRAEANAGSDDEREFQTSAELIERVFPSPRFVRIVREDVDSQAVSYWRALQSRTWSVNSAVDVPKHDTPYSFEGIEECRRVLENGERCWERLLRQRGDEALVVTYEQLNESYAATVERVAEFLRPDTAMAVAPPTIRRLRDGRSRELLERYRAERRAQIQAENMRLKQALIAQEVTIAYLHQRHDTLCRIERGGWWRLRGRLGPALRAASRLRASGLYKTRTARHRV
jgi:trehalose 2-sulfotransferase